MVGFGSAALLARRLHGGRDVREILVARRLVFDDSGAVTVSRLGNGDLGVGVQIDLLLGPVGAGQHDPDLLLLARRRLRHRRLAVGGVDLGVVAGDVAHAGLGQELVPPLHLVDRPAQRQVRLLGIGHHRQQQVRDPLVDRQLQHLGVDHDEADLFGRRVVEDAGDHPVDRHRLARPGRSGDQQVRHLGEVHGDRRPLDVLAQRHLQLRRRAGEGGVLQDLLEVDDLARQVRHLDADHRLAGDRRHDADRLRLQRHRQVLLQVGDLAGARAGGRRELVHGDDRSHVDLFDLAAHAVVRHRLLEPLGHFVELLLVHVVAPAAGCTRADRWSAAGRRLRRA